MKPRHCASSPAPIRVSWDRNCSRRPIRVRTPTPRFSTGWVCRCGHSLSVHEVQLSHQELERRVRETIREMERAGLRRHLRPPSGIDFSSNDYLGLSTHPRVKQKMAEAVMREGCGSTGSRLLRGNRKSFTEAEDQFATFKGTDAALYFGSGYAANLGVLGTFIERHDLVFSDEHNHA